MAASMPAARSVSWKAARRRSISAPGTGAERGSTYDGPADDGSTDDGWTDDGWRRPRTTLSISCGHWASLPSARSSRVGYNQGMKAASVKVWTRQ